MTELPPTIEHEITDLLWHHLPRVAGHPDRRQTGWGSKTKLGLYRCMKRIIEENDDGTTHSGS
jgi:hypothetical protein